MSFGFTWVLANRLSRAPYITCYASSLAVMAIMAAVKSFLYLFFFGLGLWATEREHEKNGLQGLSGPPQRSKFPENAEAGKCDSDCGIELLSLLFETSKLVRLGDGMLGGLPEKPLFSRKSPVRRVRLLMANGIGPVKLLELRS
ncbi:hypothetical protein TB2_013810 [Malus domestica]